MLFLFTTIVVLVQQMLYLGEMDKENHLKSWINAHPHLTLSSVCRSAGVDKGNFNRWLHKEKSLSQEHLSKIMLELFEYGYKWYELPTLQDAIEKIAFPPTIGKPKHEKGIPPMPVKETGEDAIDFGARKNLWKNLYGNL